MGVLAEAMAAKGYTVQSLAELVGVSERYIQMLLSGERNNPSLEMLRRFERALDVPGTLLFP